MSYKIAVWTKLLPHSVYERNTRCSVSAHQILMVEIFYESGFFSLGKTGYVT